MNFVKIYGKNKTIDEFSNSCDEIVNSSVEFLYDILYNNIQYNISIIITIYVILFPINLFNEFST